MSGAIEEDLHPPQEEEVFCSDGLPPIEIKPYVYVSGRKKGGEEDVAPLEEQGGSALLEDGVSAMSAFEVFQGKLMPFTTTHSLYREEPSGGRTSKDETPLEKLARLQNEVKDLQADIAAVEANVNPQAEDSETQKGDASAEMSMLVQDLAMKLDAIKLSQNSPSSAPANLRTKLTQLVYDELARIKEEEPRDQKEDMHEKQSPLEDKGRGTIKYELYAKTGKSPSDMDVNEGVEARLLALEKVLGTSNISVGKSSLSERVAAIERTVQFIDSSSAGRSNISDVANRAKIIRADLEAAAKARSKLANVTGISGVGGSSSAVDAKQISELYDQLQLVKEVSDQVPIVVERCHDLATLHTCAADSMSRLDAIEHTAQRTETLLQSLESSLSKLEESAAENLMLMQQNVQQLEGRLPAE